MRGFNSDINFLFAKGIKDDLSLLNLLKQGGTVKYKLLLLYGVRVLYLINLKVV